MPNYRLVPPAIRWGVNLANAIYFPSPSDSVFSGSEPRAGSQFIQLPSGVEAGWRVGTDYVWLGTQRWIPQADTLFYPRCTGWDGTLGIRAALEALQNRQTFSWHPDGRNLLRYPTLTSTTVGSSNLSGWGQQFTGSTSGVTISFDAGTGAWKIVGTATAPSQYVELDQYFPAIPGEVFTLSADYKVSGLGTGANGALFTDAVDAGLVYLGTFGSVTGLTSTSFLRATTGPSSVLPASTALVRVSLRLQLPSNGSTGTIWFKNAMERRDSTDATFIDNPSVDGVYFVEPTQLSPANESDGSRQLVMRIRTPTGPFDGY
jgi:hypothetical protein